uniref:CCHC-type domain-containing protein n=1 Tax=Myripristis murdjan TaxID=586833 RepID=A0A667XHW8_9TELE
ISMSADECMCAVVKPNINSTQDPRPRTQRGHIFYAGQPKTCRKCGSSCHLAANCNVTFCRNCQSTAHTTKDCNQPMRCNLCSSSTHTFRSCPQSYANRARQSASTVDKMGGYCVLIVLIAVSI